MISETVSAKKLRQERILLVLTLVSFSLASITSGMFFFRLDLTSNRSFTLSPATRGLYAQIPETVYVTYYVSESLAARHPGPKAVEDLLREIEAHARGRIRVSVRDPSGNPGTVESLGIAPLRMEVDDRGESRLATVYSGVVVEYLDDFRVLPSVLGTDDLEYELVKSVRSLVRGVVPVAALLEGDGDKDAEGDYRLLRAALARAGYQVRVQNRGAEVEPDVSALFVLGNADLDEWDAYAVDRYLHGGGRVFAAVRGVRVDPDRGLVAIPLASNPLVDLLARYGVAVRDELVLDDSSLSVPFQTRSPRGASEYKLVRYPHWVITDRRNVLLTHPAVAGFSGLDLFWPSPLEISRRTGLEYAALVKSTPKAWKQTENFAAGPEDEAFYREEEDRTRGQYTLAVAVSGSFPSGFARAPRRRSGLTESEPAPERESESRPGRLVVVGSVDFLTDLMSMSRSEYNASFAVSSADWLTSEDDMPLPTRTRGMPKLKPASDPAARASLIRLVYAIDILAVPALAALYAVARSSRRKRDERADRGRQTRGRNPEREGRR